MKKTKIFRSILTLILVATLTLTSILSASAESGNKNQTPEGYFLLKQIINSDGQTNDSGKKYITGKVDSKTSYSLYNNDDNIEFRIIYKYNSNITTNTTMQIYENGSNSKVIFEYLDTSVPLVNCNYTGSIVPEFTNIERINIDFQHSCTYTTSYLMNHMTSRYTEKESLELANSSFQLAMSAWEYALIGETQGVVTFDDLSFSIECEHKGGTANCIEQAICSTCSEAYGTINKSNHKTPTIFKYAKIDENNHKKLYDCCGEEYGDYAPHIIVKVEEKPATCTEPGYKAYERCIKCDYTNYKAIPAIGHELIVVDEVAAQRGIDGIKAHDKCTACGKKFIGGVEKSDIELKIDALPVYAEGWKLDGIGWWYQYANGSYAIGWAQIGGSWYYFNASGYMVTGWLNDGGVWYYMSGSGAMHTGWLNDGGTWYYMSGSGAMAIGWVSDGGAWYYMSGSGAMATGWVYDGAWYYMNSSGAMVSGWQVIGGTWYYFYSGGNMATGWILDGGVWYLLDSSGAWIG